MKRGQKNPVVGATLAAKDLAGDVGSLLDDMKRSLLAGESYEEFEEKWLSKMGIDSKVADAEPAGWLEAADKQMNAELREAWSQAVATLDQAESGKTKRPPRRWQIWRRR